jgi:hypothetical protein
VYIDGQEYEDLIKFYQDNKDNSQWDLDGDDDLINRYIPTRQSLRIYWSEKRAQVRWTYYKFKWQARHTGYRLKFGVYPNPTKVVGQTLFKYDEPYSFVMFDELNFVSPKVSSMMHSVLFTSPESE